MVPKQRALSPPRFLSSSYRWWVVCALLVLNITLQWQRYLPSFLAAVSVTECTNICGHLEFQMVCAECSTPACEACTACRLAADAGRINLLDGCCVTRAEYAILCGLGYSLTFGVVGVAAGWLVDRRARDVVLVLTVTGALWSAVGVLESFSSDFTGLLLARIAQGALQAFAFPCCYVIMAGYFSKGDRSLANGVFNFGTYLGYGLASLSLVISLRMGWRQAMVIAGGVGSLAAGVVAATVKRPAVVRAPGGALPRYRVQDAVGFTCANGVFLGLLGAAGLRFMGGGALASYAAMYFGRTFPDKNGTFAVANALIVSLGGTASAFMGGRLGGLWVQRDASGLALVPAIGFFLACPPLIGVFWSQSFESACACLFFVYLFAECWLGPAMALIQTIVPLEHMGVATSAYMFCMTAAESVAPYVIGSLDPGTPALRHPLSVFLLLTYAGSAAAFWGVARALKKGAAAAAAARGGAAPGPGPGAGARAEDTMGGHISSGRGPAAMEASPPGWGASVDLAGHREVGGLTMAEGETKPLLPRAVWGAGSMS